MEVREPLSYNHLMGSVGVTVGVDDFVSTALHDDLCAALRMRMRARRASTLYRIVLFVRSADHALLRPALRAPNCSRALAITKEQLIVLPLSPTCDSVTDDDVTTLTPTNLSSLTVCEKEILLMGGIIMF